jgi:hypothetical protein
MAEQHIGRDQINIRRSRDVYIQHTERTEAIKRYVVGIDLGDGESCLSYVAVNSSLTGERPLFSMDGRETILSAVAFLGTDEIVIGEAAMSENIPIELEINFKNDPIKNRDQWFQNSSRILSFVKKLFEEFSKKHSTIAEDCEVFIGCPSGWKKESREKYEQHFEQYFNGDEFPPCRVVPESRAALIQALDLARRSKDQDSENSLRKLIRKRVLLIDIGSSTTDITVLDNLQPYEVEIGGDLGLKLVDEQLLSTLCKMHPEGEKLKTQIEKDRLRKQFLLYLCRLAKEYGFGRDVDPTKFFDKQEEAKSCWEQMLSFNLKDSLSDEFFWGSGESWLDRYHSLLKKLKSSPSVDCPDVVIITGGGSNIQQLLDVTGEVFQGAFLVRDPEPSLSVARGLAGYGQCHKNVERFSNDAIMLIRGSKLESKVSSEVSPFLGEVVRLLVKASVEAVWQPMAYKWKDENLNLHDRGGLVSYIFHLYQKWLDKGNSRLFDPALERISNAANLALQDDIAELGNRYGLPVGSFRIRLRLSSIDFFMPQSPGGGLLSEVSKAYMLFQDLGFQAIDQVPTWLRKFAHSSGFLDLALDFEKLAKHILSSVVAPLYNTGGAPPEIQQRIISFVRDAAEQELIDQLDTVEKLLLEEHKYFRSDAK